MVQPNFSSQEDDVVSLIIQYGNVTDDSEHVLLSHAVPLDQPTRMTGSKRI